MPCLIYGSFCFRKVCQPELITNLNCVHQFSSDLLLALGAADGAWSRNPWLGRKLSKLSQLPSLAAGAPYESRTHATAVKEQCLDRLTNGAYKRHYRSSHALVVYPSFFKLGVSCMSSLKLIEWLIALLLGVHSTSAITTSRLEGLRSGLPKTHPAIPLNAIHLRCPRRIGCDNKWNHTWLQETSSLCYLLSHGIITIFRLILSLDYIEDYII